MRAFEQDIKVSTGGHEMLPDIKIYDLKRLDDNRGFFCELLRLDWLGFLGHDEIMQTSLSLNYPDVIKAWHRHSRGQIDYITPIQGSIRVCVYDDRNDSITKGHLTEIFLDEKKPQVIRVPGYYWHGIMVTSELPSMILYFVTKLYNYNDPDEERRPWNDTNIVPKSINENVNDMRVNKPWAWEPSILKG